MGDQTGIEWTDATWNPIVGCSVVSPGCTNCYAMKMAARLEKMLPSERRGDAVLPNHYADLTKASRAGPVWTGRVTLAPDHILTAPLRRRKPTRWFVNSMGDLFHESVPDAWIDRVSAVMALAPQHTFQVLTKRAKRMRKYLADKANRVNQVGRVIALRDHETAAAIPLPNVWLGISAEDQPRADERIPDLLATPAAVRFVSAEPLLGAIDLSLTSVDARLFPHLPGLARVADDLTVEPLRGAPRYGIPRIDWIIVGGESGRGARPMHPDWARSIRDQCNAASIPFFFKQWGEFSPGYDRDVDDPDWRRCQQVVANTEHFQWLNVAGGQGFHGERVVSMARVGKRRAGRLLDGVQHDAMPQ